MSLVAVYRALKESGASEESASAAVEAIEQRGNNGWRDRADEHLTSMERRLVGVEAWVKLLDERLGRVEERLDRLEERVASLDAYVKVSSGVIVALLLVVIGRLFFG